MAEGLAELAELTKPYIVITHLSVISNQRVFLFSPFSLFSRVWSQ